MIKFFNALLTVVVLAAAFMLYSLEFSKRAAKREIAKLEVNIAEEKENMKLLTAEWSSLQRPLRLEALAKQFLDLRQAKQTQFVKFEELGERIPDRTAAFSANQTPDPVGAMIESFAE
jgi:cell division protein FtsL